MISDALPPQRIVLARDGRYPANAAEKAVTEVALRGAAGHECAAALKIEFHSGITHAALRLVMA
jgi:hypothetical protein